ncbi:MAG: bacillithiol biosynthesis cysteine-adding enzyme BshC [Candidatus Heimdallarchaeota archaeon]|nr:bacillithiol biosynthesis cysteine-adding enzyme BshC [Candidatus Heimdallarchaeota archaeon]
MGNEIDLEALDLEIMYPNTMLLDYLDGKQPMFGFFGKKPDKLHTINFKGDRSILQEILLNYNKSIDAHDNSIANIEQVEDEKVKFVITGQQPGLFTGPLYTIYKTFSAINYSKLYSTNDTKLIPMFWNASEDHDIEEVNNIWLLNKENNVIQIRIDAEEILGQSLEELPLNKKTLEQLIKQMINASPETDFSDRIFKEFLLGELKKSEKWGEFFSRLLSKLMEQWGLIIVEPKIFRPYLKQYFTTLMSDPIKYNSIFLNTTEKLNELGYKPKMHKKENVTGLFFIDEPQHRNTITLLENGLYEISNGMTLTKEEILNEIAGHPERFSTNAIFRPLAQDQMMPTYLFVGGPSEIGYHIQIKDLYKEFGLTQPNLAFRMGATVIERHINRIIERYNFKITELWDLNQLTNRLLRKENDDILKQYFTRITSTLDELNQELTTYNKELGSRVENRKRSIVKDLDNIEKMYYSYIRNDNTLLQTQLEKTRSYLFPNDIPQERKFNIFQYLNKYSFTMLDCMRNLLSKNQPGKHVVLKCWMF